MTEIKRYDVVLVDGVPAHRPSEQGRWVKHGDLAELQDQLQRYSMSAGQVDQRKSESDAVRVALGFSADADDVAPCDLVDAIAALQEQVRALAAENSALARYFSTSSVAVNHWNSWADTEDKLACAPETPATDAFIREIRAQARAEGIHFAANRLLAAWESGFVNDAPAAAHDISGAILSAVEFLPNADEDEFRRDYADEVRARIRAGEKS